VERFYQAYSKSPRPDEKTIIKTEGRRSGGPTVKKELKIEVGQAIDRGKSMPGARSTRVGLLWEETSSKGEWGRPV